MLIDNIFTRVHSDLVKKGKGGYASNDEFNRDFNDVQNKLLTYYVRMFEQHREVTDATVPLRKRLSIPVKNGIVELPEDYRHLISLDYRFIEQAECGDITTDTTIPCLFLPELERALTLTSATRGPSLSKKVMYHTMENGKVQIHPSVTGNVNMSYFIQAPVATRAVTVDLVNIQENYDAANTVDPVWPDQEEVNLIALMLFYKGIEIKDNDIIQWALQNRQL